MGIGAGSIYGGGGESPSDLIKVITGSEPVVVDLSVGSKQINISLDPNFTAQVAENTDNIAELQTLVAQAARVAVVDLAGSTDQTAITNAFNSYFSTPAQPGDKVFDDNAASGLPTTTWIFNNAGTWVQINTAYNLFDANFSGLIRQPPSPADGNVVALTGVPGVGTVSGWISSVAAATNNDTDTTTPALSGTFASIIQSIWNKIRSVANALNSYLPLAGGTMSQNAVINWPNLTTGVRNLIYATVGDNDQIAIRAGAKGNNDGYLELATGDDATEPIHVSQYSGVPATQAPSRRTTLMDGEGNMVLYHSLYVSRPIENAGVASILVGDQSNGFVRRVTPTQFKSQIGIPDLPLSIGNGGTGQNSLGLALSALGFRVDADGTSRDAVTASTNWNSLRKTGVYQVGVSNQGSNLNSPCPNGSYHYGTLFVMCQRNNIGANGAPIAQIYFKDDGEIYYRSIFNSSGMVTPNGGFGNASVTMGNGTNGMAWRQLTNRSETIDRTNNDGNAVPLGYTIPENVVNLFVTGSGLHRNIRVWQELESSITYIFNNGTSNLDVYFANTSNNVKLLVGQFLIVTRGCRNVIYPRTIYANLITGGTNFNGQEVTVMCPWNF